MAEDASPTSGAFQRERARARAEFTRQIRRDLRRELRFSRRFASGGWRALSSVTSSQGHGITLALTRQALGDFEAIISLASQGYADQCLMLWRPMFEKMLVARWAELHPETATSRFSKQHRHRLLIANRIAKEMPELAYGQVPFPEAEPGEEEALNREFGRWGDRGVTGRNVYRTRRADSCHFGRARGRQLEALSSHGVLPKQRGSSHDIECFRQRPRRLSLGSCGRTF